MTEKATEEGYLRCPGCKAFILVKDIEPHENSNHKDFLLKQEEVTKNSVGGVTEKPVNILIQVIDMAHAYPRPWLFWTAVTLTGGYLLAWYSIFR